MRKELDDLNTTKDNTVGSQFVRYLIVGISSASIELLLFTTFRMLSLNLSLSNIIATIIATLFNFFTNRGWSFRGSSKLNRSSIMYLALFCLNITFSTNAISYMVKSGVLEAFAKLITMALITMWNFILYRKVVFK